MQGTLVESYVRCGTKSCGCHVDPERRHGPHLYLKFRTREGKQSAIYVPRSHEREVREAVEAWGEAWETLVSLSQGNREKLHARLRRRKKSARR